MKLEGTDPRTLMIGETLDQATRPRVQTSGRPRSQFGTIAVMVSGTIGLVGFIAVYKPASQTAPTTEMAATAPMIAVPADVTETSKLVPLNMPGEVLPAPSPAQITPIIEPTPAQIGAIHQPVLIIDNSSGAATEHISPAQTDMRTADSLGSNAQFALKMSGESVAHAVQIGDQSTQLLQGTLIPATLETEINSDLPGYVRAVVSSDVRSADGSQVLIPRGSRLIGQYKSALSTGETRVMIVWDRLLRPDGTSVTLASPATDTLGQEGVTGKVHNHYGTRYGAYVMLTLLSGLATGLANTDSSSTTVVISTSSSTSSSAGSTVTTSVSPTVEVRAGIQIQVFLTRDLTFDKPY